MGGLLPPFFICILNCGVLSVCTVIIEFHQLSALHIYLPSHQGGFLPRQAQFLFLK